MPGGCAGVVPVATRNFGGQLDAVTVVHEHGEPVRVQETRLPGDRAHHVAVELVLEHLDLVADGDVQALHEITGADAFLDPVAAPVESTLAPAGQIQDGFAQRLAGNGGGMHARTADDGVLFDHGDRPAELGRLDRRALPGRTAAENDKVEMLHARFRVRPPLLRGSVRVVSSGEGEPGYAPARLA